MAEGSGGKRSKVGQQPKFNIQRSADNGKTGRVQSGLRVGRLMLDVRRCSELCVVSSVFEPAYTKEGPPLNQPTQAYTNACLN